MTCQYTDAMLECSIICSFNFNELSEWPYSRFLRFNARKTANRNRARRRRQPKLKAYSQLHLQWGTKFIPFKIQLELLEREKTPTVKAGLYDQAFWYTRGERKSFRDIDS
jgi:hypothetical protein